MEQCDSRARSSLRASAVKAILGICPSFTSGDFRRIHGSALRLFFAQAIINVITLFPEHYAENIAITDRNAG
jgi:hypothetical protein